MIINKLLKTVFHFCWLIPLHLTHYTFKYSFRQCAVAAAACVCFQYKHDNIKEGGKIADALVNTHSTLLLYRQFMTVKLSLSTCRGSFGATTTEATEIKKNVSLFHWYLSSLYCQILIINTYQTDQWSGYCSCLSSKSVYKHLRWSCSINYLLLLPRPPF